MNLFEAASALASASPAVMLAMFIFALLRKWLILPRELAQRDKRIAQLEHERDEFKEMAYKALRIGERVTKATEQGQP